MKLLAIPTAIVLATALSLSATGAHAQDAAALYKSKCQGCHSPDGTGSTAAGKKLGAKDFHSPEIAKMSDTDFFDITKQGKNKMPAYDKKLTDDQIKDLIKYIRSMK